MNHGCDAIRQMRRKDITEMLPDEYKSDVKDSIAELALLLADTDSEVILAFAQRDSLPIEDEEYGELFAYHSRVCDKDGKEVEGREN